MISSVSWQLDPASARWLARVGRRELAIGWDEDADTLFLAVTVPPPPNVEGATPRMYVSPIPLLAALLILPESEHEVLRSLTAIAVTEVRDERIVGGLQRVLEESIEDWPKPAVAAKRLTAAAELMPRVVRLSEDLAAGGAFREGV